MTVFDCYLLCHQWVFPVPLPVILEGFSSVWLLPLQTENSLCYWGPGPAVEPGPAGSVGPGLLHESS